MKQAARYFTGQYEEDYDRWLKTAQYGDKPKPELEDYVLKAIASTVDKMRKPEPVEASLARNPIPGLSPDELGKAVRDQGWLPWASQQPNPKDSWLVPWDDLNETDREADRQIGLALLQHIRKAMTNYLVSGLVAGVNNLIKGQDHGRRPTEGVQHGERVPVDPDQHIDRGSAGELLHPGGFGRTAKGKASR